MPVTLIIPMTPMLIVFVITVYLSLFVRFSCKDIYNLYQLINLGMGGDLYECASYGCVCAHVYIQAAQIVSAS